MIFFKFPHAQKINTEPNKYEGSKTKNRYINIIKSASMKPNTEPNKNEGSKTNNRYVNNIKSASMKHNSIPCAKLFPPNTS